MSTNTPTIEQQYEYTTVSTKMKDFRSGELETVLNEHGDEGWELVDRMDIKGTTLGFIHTRPV